jgi:chromosome segregation ATPase
MYLRLRRKLHALRAENSDLKDRASQHARSVEELERRIETLKDTNIKLASERDNLSAQLKQCKQTVSDLTTQVSQLRTAWKKQKKCLLCWLLGF